MPDFDTLVRQFTETLAAAGRTERTIENYVYALRGFGRFLQPRTISHAVSDDIVAYLLAPTLSVSALPELLVSEADSPGRRQQVLRPVHDRPQERCAACDLGSEVGVGILVVDEIVRRGSVLEEVLVVVGSPVVAEVRRA